MWPRPVPSLPEKQLFVEIQLFFSKLIGQAGSGDHHLAEKDADDTGPGLKWAANSRKPRASLDASCGK
jgi:hypothetical protein